MQRCRGAQKIILQQQIAMKRSAASAFNFVKMIKLFNNIWDSIKTFRIVDEH